MPAIQARRDLLEKVKFERSLKNKVAKINRSIVRKTVQQYGNEGTAFDALIVQPELEEMLATHYDKVGGEFSDRITEVLPSDIAVTQVETSAVNQALATYFTARAAEQSLIISKTNQRDINSAISSTVEESQSVVGGVSRQEQATQAGAKLSRKLKGREESISSLETQAPAEASKLTELEVLAGHQPSVVAGTPAKIGVDKTWFTQGDERVRPAHVAADSQEVDASDPFIVGGERLRFPGDTSLGASVGNVVNCRCGSVGDTQQVIALRRNRGRVPTFETEPGEGLLESIGEL